jgi:hypothetical protein
MSTTQKGPAGTTRICPHCRAVILESASICPACDHHLRFDPSPRSKRSIPTLTPLKVEGTIAHPPSGEAWEYSVVVSIRNDRGEEIARQVIGVGALPPSEQRTFSLSVEVFAPAR